MKELSIEEKAKAYDEAIEKAKNWYVDAQIDFKKSLETIFPELKESEDGDEKVRKALIKLVTNHASMDLFIEYDIHLDEALAWLEKQGEQKPAKWRQDNVEELTEFENVMMHIGNSFFGENAGLDPNDTNVIKEQANLLLELVPKQEWSEEDENIKESIITGLEMLKDGASDKSLIALYNKKIDWLKSLRPQNNATDEELAKAKKNAYNDALNKIEYHSGEPTFDDGWSAAIWYLKKRNAQPQSTWKPSDEQMFDLKCAADLNSNVLLGQSLLSLYNDLRKLKE